MKVRVLVVDDHGVVRTGIGMYLGTDPGIEVIGEGRNGQEALELARRLKPDVVLMDLSMPVMDGVAATRVIRGELPEIKVVALTSVLEDAAVTDAVSAGAIGYVLKTAESEDVRYAIKAAARGETYISPAALKGLMRNMAAPEPASAPLTPREIEVLRLLAAGRSNREIATALSVTDQTVKSHVSHILGKLGVFSRTQAALYAVESGITPGSAGSAGKSLQRQE